MDCLVHGESGLDGVTGLPDSNALQVQNMIQSGRDSTALKALERHAEEILRQKRKFTLIATGAWTNVALFLKAFEELAKESLEEIVLMGGRCLCLT